MSNKFKPIKWVNKQIKDLQILRKKNRNKYVFLAILQTSLNLASVAIAIWGIVRLSSHSSGTATEVMLASFAAAGVVVIFILNNVNIIYRGMMKDKTYKKALDQVQFEVMSYKANPNTYKGKNAEEQLIKNVEEIYEHAVKKRVKKSFSLFLRAMTGGEDV